ncbi:unnamed protein product [Rangifer tarandus platyrhynchus]|uniref:Uncharacterized protein n=2 Tax=Rangifer tarandus platyrhynchus TaxID=3082113 RepID=A0ABN8XU16_RANTA|nr:unnamed protein product [Rangifer tarandus platyrhynchus]CAI9691561.1 unnamed protein product [Rangifer tarandus platyrhynchus]
MDQQGGLEDTGERAKDGARSEGKGRERPSVSALNRAGAQQRAGRGTPVCEGMGPEGPVRGSLRSRGPEGPVRGSLRSRSDASCSRNN